eukprot:CAMPEP_0115012206 /NCGR_PEP_ID=MMETSP0216-20121206/24570_1 /TAXON_ID=223996 /ORGANISM="Protocruzia adherens, Strain Boccale" /LENGTH=121 /DNA_ID=CAMNT_0002381161 /DNA_START=32 /DNA_END=397 /DNA_ORIENTATION=-
MSKKLPSFRPAHWSRLAIEDVLRTNKKAAAPIKEATSRRDFISQQKQILEVENHLRSSNRRTYFGDHQRTQPSYIGVNRFEKRFTKEMLMTAEHYGWDLEDAQKKSKIRAKARGTEETQED